jgi:hypothetical protein
MSGLKVPVGQVFVGGKDDRFSISVWDGNKFNGQNSPLGYLDKKQLRLLKAEINKALKQQPR